MENLKNTLQVPPKTLIKLRDSPSLHGQNPFHLKDKDVNSSKTHGLNQIDVPFQKKIRASKKKLKEDLERILGHLYLDENMNYLSNQGFGWIQIRKGNIEDEDYIDSRLGPNLENIKSKFNCKLSMKTVLIIGIQVLQSIEMLHSKGCLHKNLTPECVRILHKNSKTLINLTYSPDHSFLDKYNKHIPYRENLKVEGNPYFLSAFGHLGIEPSRRDDLISLGFVLLSLLTGKLPWKNEDESTLEEIYKIKVKISSQELCKGLPEQFCEYFENVRNLRFNEKPDYFYLIDLFEKIMKENGFEDDGTLELKEQENKGIDLKARKILENPLSNYYKELDSIVFSETLNQF